MRFLLKIAACLLILSGAIFPQLHAQSKKKVVTIQLTRKADGFTTRVDTTFVVNDDADAYSVLRRLERQYGGENASLEKVIIFIDYIP